MVKREPPKTAKPIIFPASLVAERAVLVAILTNPSAMMDILSSVVPEDFVNPEHRLVFRIAGMLFEKQQPIDMVTVSVEYKKRNELKSQFLISDLFKEEQNPGGYRTHVAQLKDLTRRRRLQVPLAEALEKVGGAGEVDEIVSDLMGTLNQMADESIKRPTAMDRVVVLSQKRMEIAVERKSKVTGIPTGFRKFDNEIGGLHAGDLTVVGARPSVGKSALLAGMALGMARRNFTALIVNAEMELVEVGTRMLAHESKIANFELRRGNIDLNQFSQVTEAAGRLGKLPLWIYDDRRWEIIKSQVRALKLKHKELAAVLIDYVQRIHMERSGKEERRYEEIGRIAKEAKDMAKDLGVAVVLAAQISRAVERDKKEPELSDLRESGDLEQDADIVTFLHRYKPKESPCDVYWLIKKNRNGPLGSIHLKFVPEEVTFYDFY